MASNDSSAAVTAVVNAAPPTLPQTESKAPEAAQANHESPSTQAAAAVPVAETPTTVKEAQSEPAPTVASTPNIPSVSPTTDLSKPILPKPIEDATKETLQNLTSDSKLEDTKEGNETSKEDEKSQVVENNTDKQPKESTPSTNTNSSNVEKPVSVSDKPLAVASSLPEAGIKNTSAAPKPVATIKPMVESTSNDSMPTIDTKSNQSNPKSNQDNNRKSNKRSAEDADESEKRMKTSTPSGSKGANKSAEEILEYMEKTFDQRRKIITKQMPTIPELKSMYPELFMGKQLLLEFQRITKIDIDQKIQEFCVRYATAVIEMARSNKAAAPVLARWEQAKQENETLKQYWDMVTALCLLPLHFGENFVEMVLEIEEDEEVKAKGKIVPTLVARGNIFRTDEFFLIAENTIVQEFEEFTIAFASLYSSYWVFNMVYPETIENTYDYIQRCIVRQREPGAISAVCKNFTKSLQKWNKEKEGK